MDVKWVAGWNIPGYLPEMEPVIFDSQEEAWDFIDEERERFSSIFPNAEDMYSYWVEVFPYQNGDE